MKTLEDYGLSYDNSLLQDMAKTWGECLENMPEADQAFLIGRLGVHYFVKHCEDNGSEQAAAVWRRMNELSKREVGALIRFLANK